MSFPEPVVAAIFAKLGGRGALGVDVASEADLARVVVRRISLRSLTYVQRHNTFTKDEIHHFVIPARTLRHRQQKKERLSVEESDRLVRMTRVQALAEDVLGNPENAQRWLRQPLAELGDIAPLDLAQTESGARVVEQILAKIDWGAAA
jgi:putative toxin-antitoxin system antitoxin component (TIGR02293 family)